MKIWIAISATTLREEKERRKYLDQEYRWKCIKKRSEMKSSVMNVQVDVTFYKKTFLFYFFALSLHNAAAARVECEAEMCSNVTLLLTILLSSTSTLCVRFESSHFFFMFFNRFSHLFRRRLQHDDAGRKISLSGCLWNTQMLSSIFPLEMHYMW